MKRITADKFPFDYFGGRIEAEFDAKKRPTLIHFVDEHGPQNYLRLDHSDSSGTYSDNYTAENYESGAVQSVHLGHGGSVKEGVGFSEWARASYLTLLRDVAVRGFDSLMDHEDPSAVAKDFLASYALYLQEAGVDRYELYTQLPLIQLGWATCSLLLGEDVDEATDTFRHVYPEVKSLIDEDELKERVGSLLPDDLW